MRLNKFKATGVYGYLKFDIPFNEGLTFLIGVNGSGKTTALRIIQALLSPSIKELMLIPFESANIEFLNNNKKIKISARKNKEEITLSVTGIKEKLKIPVMDESEISFITSNNKRSKDIFENMQFEYSDTKLFKFIYELSVPVFLGLDRTHKSHFYSNEDLFYQRQGNLFESKMRSHNSRIYQGSLAAGLKETQILIRDTYRRLRSIEDKHSERLKESIVLSAFKYDEMDFLLNRPSLHEQEVILKRRNEIEQAVNKIGLSGKRISKILDKFFNGLEALFKSMENAGENKGVNIEWLLNKAQVDRIFELIEIIDKNKSKVDKLFSPINTFIELMNSFYKDTKKNLSIDTVGELSIKRPDGREVGIDALSSGERQLLIIFAHLIFNEYGNRSNIFIIDEPELSLHLKWQEDFVRNALNVSPDTQLILATHSPEIVGEYTENSISI